MTSNKELIAALRAAVEAAPEAIPLRRHLADMLFESGDYAEATEIYRGLLDELPGDDALRRRLAKAYVALDEPHVALAVLERLIDQPTVEPDVLIDAARLYADQGQLADAAHCYRQAIAANPSLVDEELASRLTLAQTEVDEPEADADDDEFVFVVAEGDQDSERGLIERPAIDFDDVGGMEQVKEEIRMKIIYPLTHPEIYEAYGKTVGGGILMYGPPGCGKTYLARATAGQVSAHFLPVGLHDVLDMYIGESERKLHALFELARSNTPCILFFDEVDALGASRSDMRYSPGRKLINQFLAELDGIQDSNEGILILAATNAPWHVDGALRRPGRFDRVIFVPPPDATARDAILRIMLEDKPVQHVDTRRLARRTAGFSGADLKGVIDRAVERKLRQALATGDPQPLTTADLQAALKETRPTTSEWLDTARNYAVYANAGGLYNDVLAYLKIAGVQ